MEEMDSVGFSLVASDYDLTLGPPPTSDISARTAHAIREVRERGVHVAVISGRSAAGILHVLRRQDIDLEGLHVIGANGAEVVDGTDGTIRVRHSLDSSYIADIVAIGCEEGIEVLVHRGSDIHVADVAGRHAQHESRVNGMNLIETPPAELATLTTERILLCGAPKRLAVAAARLRQRLGEQLEVHGSASHLVEVTAAGINKGRALTELAALLGVDMNDVAAFGDNHNDVPLLQAAGTGVAVANAVGELIAIADHVAPSCEDDGVAQFLEAEFGFAAG